MQEQEARLLNLKAQAIRAALVSLLGLPFLPLSTAVAADLSAGSPVSAPVPADASAEAWTHRPAIELLTLRTHSRLAIRVDEGVVPEWKQVPGGFELFFKGIGLADLGVPLGSEEEWSTEREQALQDTRLKSLQIQELPTGLKLIGKWRFPEGELAPADPTMETFDYREKKPTARYVIDFWGKQGPTLREVRIARERAARIEAERKREARNRDRAERRLASVKATQSSQVVIERCDQPLAEARDVFLPFVPVHQGLELSKWLPSTSPDALFKYREPEPEAPEHSYVRLAVELYRQGKHALALKTIEFFEKELPSSPYRVEMKFLRANVLLKLELPQESDRILRDLMVSARDSEPALHAGMYLAYQDASKGAHLQALETFLWLSHFHESHRLGWLFHLAAAEAHYALKQLDRAVQEYRWVMRSAPEPEYQAQGALRLGDLFLERRQYDQALAAYFQGITDFKAEAKKFPSAHINRAESLYWLGQYDRAAEEFESFLKEFPGHPAGWRAAYRLGEIHGRKEGAEARRLSRHWFTETINRNPASPGVTLSRLRLAECDDHGGLSASTAERFFVEEALPYTGAGEVSLKGYRDWVSLTRVRTVSRMASSERTVDVAIEELKTPGMSKETVARIQEILDRQFRHAVLKLLADGKKYEALSFYQKRAEHLKPTEPDFLLKLSQAASDLGLGTVAKQLSDAHRGANGGRAIASGDTASSLEARNRKAEERFTEAKALWIAQGAQAETRVRELLAEVHPESEHSYESEIILGLLDEKTGKPASALGHALRAQLLIPPARAQWSGTEQARITHWIASLQIKAGSPRQALELLRKLQQTVDKNSASGLAAHLGVPPVASKSALLVSEAEILSGQGRWGEAASAYARAVEDGKLGDQGLYAYARALLKTGGKADRNKALEALEKLAQGDQTAQVQGAAENKDEFWRKLAREALANEKSKNTAGRSLAEIPNIPKEGGP